MDTITISNLEIFAHHGVFEEENTLGQKFLISAKLHLNTRKAGMSDDLNQSIDYGSVCHSIKKLMEQNTFKLIEAVCETIANFLLLEYEQIEEVEVEVKKPWAPILLPIDTVSVTITRRWHIAYLSIGSNVGDKEGYLDSAIDRLNEDEYTKVMKASAYIETEPYGDVEQENFLNGALEIHTLRSPEELLELIHDIEKEAKRERIIHWGPRTLDIDIVFYDNEIIATEDLIVPHIDMENRNFVLEPMHSIAPYARHPIYKKTISQLYNELNNK